MTDNISRTKHGTVYAGPAAVDIFRMRTTLHGLKLWHIGIKISRGVTLKRLLEVATTYTGNKYPRSRNGASAAAEDMVEAIKLALLTVEVNNEDDN